VGTLLFPDNTVLINFALINRMDLLERLANGRGRWCASVASECHASAGQPGLGALADADAIFGQPLSPDIAELVDAKLLREELASPGDHRHQHLGEAETLAIMIRRRLTGFFVTDDREAARLATKLGVPVATTWRLFQVASRQAWLDSDTLWGYVRTLKTSRRGYPPGVTDRASFDKWLDA
jgi:predicted nucleic acid-binding protein